MNKLALHHGPPVRTEFLPYCAHWIEQDDIDAVEEVLRHGWLTTGPKVQEFESKFAEKINVSYAVAFSSGTSALLGAIDSLNLGPGDEVIVPALTFVASVNCVVFAGATPVFCDIDPETLLIDCKDVARKITARTKAIIAVDYAGHPCDYNELNAIKDRHGLSLVSDASHSIGAKYNNEATGSHADVTAFSFHPTKNITTGEGGMLVTNSASIASRAKQFRSHGISKNPQRQHELGSWHYEMTELGYNHRLSDILCALGISQLSKLDKWVRRRNQISEQYRRGLETIPHFIPQLAKKSAYHAYHLFVVKINQELVHTTRAEIFKALQAEGIGVNVHYMPVHLHPYYRTVFGTHEDMCPNAELAARQLLTLPIFPQMTDQDAADVLNALSKVASHYGHDYDHG